MTKLFAGVDVGGTAVKVGVCDDQGHVCARGSVPTDAAAPPEQMLDRIAVAVHQLAGDTGDIAACGVGTPGPLDPERRALHRANHLPMWTNVAIPQCLGDRLGIPVVLENDANCATWAEACIGAGRGAHSVVLVTLGTGVGGGIVLNGDLWTGVSGAAGALGHLVIDPAGPLCLCGQRGCLETYASATSVARRFGRGSALDAFAAAKQGDAAGIAAISDASDALGAAIALIVHTLQPEVVILGGGMSAAGDALLVPVREAVRQRVRPAWLERTRIVTASLGGDAGWIGAALWAASSISQHSRTH
ncbi:MAG: ROK family protein [bacterium]